jgi:hypothetical protein
MADLLTPMLQRLTDYVEARLEADSVPVRSSAIVGGQFVAWDDCCDDNGQSNGQLRVRVTRTALTDRFPQEPADILRCPTGTIVNVEIGVLRCAATMDDQGNPPTAAQLDAEAALLMADRKAIFMALLCDFPADGTMDEDRGIANIVWEPMGPEGGCVGGMVTADIELIECNC